MKPVSKTEKVEVIDNAMTGNACRKHREKEGVSLTDLANYLGISVPYLSQLEKGKRNWTTRLCERHASGCEHLSRGK